MSRLLGLLIGVLFLLPSPGFCKDKTEGAKTSEKKHSVTKFPQLVNRAFGYAEYALGSVPLKVGAGESIPVYLIDNPTNMAFDVNSHYFIIKSPGFYLIRYSVARPLKSNALLAIGSEFSLPSVRYAEVYPPAEPTSTPGGEPLPPLAKVSTSLVSTTGEIVRYLNIDTKVKLGVVEGTLDYTDSPGYNSVVATLFLQKISR